MRFATVAGSKLVLASLITLSLATPGLAAEQTLRPGKWEVLTTGSIDQAGQKTEMPESRAEMCVEPAPETVAETPADSGCTIETLEKSSGKLVTRATCGEVVTDSAMTWNDESYESVSHMVMTSGGQTIMESDTKSTGRYLGACG
ncbi:uncharacterized protein DUF3617 [Dongia mobilis]|uniref:Uncharacterized protein DUF3617 n=1 Tax=Dongia mobilis TaxID=578943 RepID=A0A4R6WSZ0_9PROT|nr:DUF3617 family protein [Dongia mobilis]TDQ82184.1 uncharacterized protein DUF3617 [Dongia mobilis]